MIRKQNISSKIKTFFPTDGQSQRIKLKISWIPRSVGLDEKVTYLQEDE